MIKAKAFKPGMTDSTTASALYTIQFATGVVATPTFSPSAGTYTNTQSVTISCDTSGATIRYTLDGSEPSSSSASYSGPISVNTGTVTIKAKAQKSGMTDSTTASVTYIVGQQSQSILPWSMLGPLGIMGIALIAVVFIVLWYRKK
jgi:chitinase